MTLNEGHEVEVTGGKTGPCSGLDRSKFRNDKMRDGDGSDKFSSVVNVKETYYRTNKGRNVSRGGCY